MADTPRWGGNAAVQGRLRPGFDGDARLAFGLALSAILVHCIFYNALFEDPMFWGLLGLAALCSELPLRRWKPAAPATAAQPSEPAEKVTA